MNLTCRSCSSKRLLRGIRVVSRGFFFFESHPVSVEFPSGGLRRPVRSSISADVCVDCGHLDLHAVDLADLQRLYAEIGEPLGLGSRSVEGSGETAS
jgi:hypothetical protein